MSKAKPVSVSYTKRFPLEPYSHEEMAVTYHCGEDCTETALEVLLRARTDVAQSSQAYLKAMKEKENKK